MKETSFIQQNKAKWNKFENAYKSGNQNPDELSNLFIEITEDLSYARTHYPKRTVRVYLNNLAQDVFTSLYRVKNRPFARFVNFWVKSLPLEAYRMRKDMLLALVIFLISATIGVVSTANDIDYAKVILGSGYVTMTDQHIDDWLAEQKRISVENNDPEMLKEERYVGSPLKVYDDMKAWPMFTMIFFNNIKVAFLMFVLGIFFGLGTLIFLTFNGIMVGTFQSYFYYKGLILKKSILWSTFLTIWIHGAFEITGIVLAAACGFSIGRSLMFPKTMTRLQSLQIGTKKGLKVFIGLSVFILFAAILESWVTRMYNMPEWGKLLIICGSFLIMFLVFVFIPFVVARKYPDEVEVNENPSFNPLQPFNVYAIRGIGEIMTDTFRLFRRQYANTLGFFFAILIPAWAIFMYFNYQENYFFMDNSIDWFTNLSILFGLKPFVFHWSTLFWSIATGVFIAHVFYTMMHRVDPEFIAEKKNYWKFMALRSLEMSIAVAPILLLFQHAHGLLIFVVMFLFPFYMPVFFSLAHGKGNFFVRFGKGFGLGALGYGTGLGVYWLLVLLCGVFFTLFTSNVYLLTEDFIKWHLETRFEHFQAILQFIRAFFFVFFYFHMVKLFVVAYSLVYYHVDESKTAKGLFSKLATFGKTNKYYEPVHED